MEIKKLDVFLENEKELLKILNSSFLKTRNL